ncbi:Piso0_004879 [Millerozyma farinosa CBS 7064]|uniref:Piso0_004879 protein n=1 Tax=Pichia sorbitophila (strain ATCC MYA-4447 / BCRC 22081 / CBS 7064 / NBRC 10061 / NRRL Y-12695) TaxID=559304 RepID=G8Y3M5_PICSO|nr:Piso0_004879 [Millerozyma farinosa CBS 7064]
MKSRSIEIHPSSSINAICPIPNTELVATGGGNDSLVKLFRLNEHEPMLQEVGKEHLNGVNSLDVVSSGEELVSGGGSNVVVWDLVKQCKITNFRSTASAVRDDILGCKILNNSLVASCGSGCHTSIFDLRNSQRSKPVFSLQMGRDSLTCIDYNDVGRNAMTVVSLDGNSYTVDFRKKELITDIMGHGSILYVKTYSEAKNVLTFDDGNVRIGSLGTIDEGMTFKISDSSLSYRINADLVSDYYSSSEHLFSGTERSQVSMWTIDSKNNTEPSFKTLFPRKRRKPGDEDIIGVVKFLAHSNRLVASSATGYLHIWDDFF